MSASRRKADQEAWELAIKAASIGDEKGVESYFMYLNENVAGSPRNYEKLGKEMNYKDGNGYTILHYLVAKNMDLAVYDVVTNYGANPFIKANDGNTPLDIAAKLELNDVIKQIDVAISDAEQYGYSGYSASAQDKDKISWRKKFANWSQPSPLEDKTAYKLPEYKAPELATVAQLLIPRPPSTPSPRRPMMEKIDVKPVTVRPGESPEQKPQQKTPQAPLSAEEKRKLFAEFPKLSERHWIPSMTTFVKDVVNFLNPMGKRGFIQDDPRYYEQYKQVQALANAGDSHAKFLLAKDFERREDYQHGVDWKDDADFKRLRKEAASGDQPYAPAMLEIALEASKDAKIMISASMKNPQSANALREARSAVDGAAEKFVAILKLKSSDPEVEAAKKKAMKAIQRIPALEDKVKEKAKEINLDIKVPAEKKSGVNLFDRVKQKFESKKKGVEPKKKDDVETPRPTRK